MGSLRNLEHTLYKNFQYEIFCPIETCISRPPTPQWFSWFQHVHERGLQVDSWLRSSRRKATALNYFFETGRPLCHLSMLHTPAFASFSFIVLTRKWCSDARIYPPASVTFFGQALFHLLVRMEVRGGHLSACYSLLKILSFKFVEPQHPLPVVFKRWSLNTLQMQILRTTPRTSWTGSPGWGQELFNNPSRRRWSTGKFRNCRFQSATRELGTKKSEAKDWEQRATAKEDGCHEPLHSLPFIG